MWLFVNQWFPVNPCWPLKPCMVYPTIPQRGWPLIGTTSRQNTIIIYSWYCVQKMHIWVWSKVICWYGVHNLKHAKQNLTLFYQWWCQSYTHATAVQDALYRWIFHKFEAKTRKSWKSMVGLWWYFGKLVVVVEGGGGGWVCCIENTPMVGFEHCKLKSTLPRPMLQTLFAKPPSSQSHLHSRRFGRSLISCAQADLPFNKCNQPDTRDTLLI